MSKLKISENLFLEVNELQKLIGFLEDDGYKRLIKPLINTYGIVRNESNSGFKTTVKSGSTNTIIVNAGMAFDSNLDAIISDSNVELTVNNTGSKRWLILSRAIKNDEVGTVSINIDGTLTGLGTEFTQVLRGQPNFPIKVKLNSSINSGEYEVVRVVSDISAILAGDFQNESGLKYQVIGTFTPGFQPLSENKMIYEYDSYQLNIVDSENKPNIGNNEFILASINFDGGGVMSVTDERYGYMFNDISAQASGGQVLQSDSNPLVSLLEASIISVDNNVVEIELILEHGYTVTSFELTPTSTSNIFKINSGKCNFLGSGEVPNGLFDGWLLVNKKNMRSVRIDNNVGNSVYISNFDSSVIEAEQNDFIIIPNSTGVEYQVTVSPNVYKPTVPFSFRNEISNVFTRVRVHAYTASISEAFEDTVNFKIKHRLVNNDRLYWKPFDDLAVAQFINVNGQTETLSNSEFEINIANIEPQEKQRNYS